MGKKKKKNNGYVRKEKDYNVEKVLYKKDK